MKSSQAKSMGGLCLKDSCSFFVSLSNADADVSLLSNTAGLIGDPFLTVCVFDEKYMRTVHSVRRNDGKQFVYAFAKQIFSLTSWRQLCVFSLFSFCSRWQLLSHFFLALPFLIQFHGFVCVVFFLSLANSK